MTLYRYMSVDEAIALFIDRHTLTNTTYHHADHHLATTSRGFTHITAETLPNPLLPQPR